MTEKLYLALKHSTKMNSRQSWIG